MGIQEENVQKNGTWRKQFQYWQNQNANRWNSSSDRERRDRLKACLQNVAQIDSNRQGHDVQVKRKSQSRRRRASRRKTQDDVLMQEQRSQMDENINKLENLKRVKERVSNNPYLEIKT